MSWSVQHDRDAFKEVWLQFASDSGHFPLYPGQSTWIEYSYTVGEDQWGNWFRRAVRLPTRRYQSRWTSRQILILQIGIERAAAIVRAPRSQVTLVLLNRTIIDSSAETDEPYEDV